MRQQLKEAKDLLRQALDIIAQLEGEQEKIHVWQAAASKDGWTAVVAAVTIPDRQEMVFQQILPERGMEEASMDALYLGLSHLLQLPMKLSQPVVLHLLCPALVAVLEYEENHGEEFVIGKLSPYTAKVQRLVELVRILRAMTEVEVVCHLEDDQSYMLELQHIARDLLRCKS